MKQLLLAFQFLTVIPIRVRGDVSEQDMARSTAFFPLVGLFQGLIAALASLLLIRTFTPDIASGLVLLIAMLCNGGFDLDGLADTTDALAVKSTGDALADRERRLVVMKDSSIGAMGVLALIMAILLKFLFLRHLFLYYSPFTAASVLLVMPAFAKWVTVPAMYHGTPARNDGLGRIFLSNVTAGTAVLSTLLVALLYIAAAQVHLFPAYGALSVTLLFALLAVLYLLCRGAVKFFIARFGGLTGDHFGAMTEVADILILAVTVLWLPHSI